MKPVSAAFLAAIAASHQMRTTVDVVLAGAAPARLLTPIAGSITLDATAAIRGRVDLAVVDDGTLGLVPTTAYDLLAPYGNALYIRRGIVYPDGSEELVGLGVFGIQTVTIDDGLSGMTIALTGQDATAQVAYARFEAPFEIAAGTLVTAAIDTVMAGAGIVANAQATIASTATTPKLVAEEGGDRLEFVNSLADSIGLQMYFDGEGLVRFQSVLPTGNATIMLVEGEAGVLVQAAREWDATASYNRWIVTGENTGEAAPVRGVASDDNLASPTYYGGPFGRRPTFYQSEFIRTTAQAQDTAAAMKAQSLGTTQRVRFGTYVNPALEPGDIVRITRVRAGIDEDHVLESLTIPLTPTEPMTGQTRAWQVS